MSYLPKDPFVKKIKANKTTVTSSQTLGYQNWELAAGSGITFTPSIDSNYVLYEYTANFSRSGNTPLIEFKLQIGNNSSSVADLVLNNVGYHSSFGFNESQFRYAYPHEQITIKHIIPTTIFTGEKYVCLHAKSSASSRIGRLHYNEWNVITGSNYIHPFVIIKSI
jgi:hypothetical protein